MVESLFLQAIGRRIHVLRAGSRGSPVVLLHGGGVDSAALSWRLLIEPLAQSYRVFAPDWPGYGNSDSLAPDEYTMDSYITALGGILDALNLERARLVGISMGGGIALGFALRRPERVEALALADSYGLQRTSPGGALGWLMVRMSWLNKLSWKAVGASNRLTRSTLRSFMHDDSAITDALIEEVHELLRRPDAGEAFRCFQRNEVTLRGLRTCYLDRLSEMAITTLFVHGQYDWLVPLPWARAAHARVAGSKLVVLPTGHWPMREMPGEFNRVVIDYLAAQGDVQPAGRN